MREKELRRALRREPHQVRYRLLLGQLLSSRKRYSQAAALYAEGVRLEPDDVLLRMNYAEALLDLDRPAEAVPQFREVLRRDPEHADAMASLGGALLRLHEPQEAAGILEQCAGRLPEDGIVQELLGEALAGCGQREAALARYRKAIELGRATPHIWSACGNLLGDLGQYAHADDAFHESLASSTDKRVPWHNWGRTRFELGDVSAAADAFRRSLDQGIGDSLRELALILPGDPHADRAEILQTRLRYADAVSLSEDGWAARSNSEKLRIGYLSSFFANANYMKPVNALLTEHDPERVQVELFDDGPQSGELRQRMREGAVTDVHHVQGTSNEELVERIRERSLDVLVDLNAYSAMHRLPVYTVRLATVVVGWFNLYATSGMPGIDVIVGDAQTVDPDEDRWFTEHVVRLPLSYLAFRVDHPAPDVVPPPSRHNGAVTFGSLCSQYKITPLVLRSWCRILREAPRARLILANRTLGSPDVAARLRETFVSAGIAAERVELRGPADHLDYLANYNDIDIALDSWPYNGGTTTTEAFWQGVPVLCFRGDRWASRTSASLAFESPFRAFLCDSEEAMVSRAIELAADPQTPAYLGALRASARDELGRSPVCDVARLAREMERLYERLLEERT